MSIRGANFSLLQIFTHSSMGQRYYRFQSFTVGCQKQESLYRPNSLSLQFKTQRLHRQLPRMQPELYSSMDIETMADEQCAPRDLFEQLLDEHSAPAMPATPLESKPVEDFGRQVRHVEEKKPPHSHSGQQGCKCTKIDCLKLYCECFARGRTCNENCICTCCGNKEGNHAEIYQAQQIANYRNPGFFKDVPAFVPNRKCTCKKSQCRKKYCECYSAGLKCTQDCECVGCQNGKCQHHKQPENDSTGVYNMGIEVYG